MGGGQGSYLAKSGALLCVNFSVIPEFSDLCLAESSLQIIIKLSSDLAKISNICETYILSFAISQKRIELSFFKINEGSTEAQCLCGDDFCEMNIERRARINLFTYINNLVLVAPP